MAEAKSEIAPSYFKLLPKSQGCPNLCSVSTHGSSEQWSSGCAGGLSRRWWRRSGTPRGTADVASPLAARTLATLQAAFAREAELFGARPLHAPILHFDVRPIVIRVSKEVEKEVV